MGILDKLKKVLVGETTKVPKKEKTISANDLKTNEIKIVDEHKNSLSEQTIEDFFSKNEEYIFNDIIFTNLFNSNNKYSDQGIFSKSEPYLKEFVEKNGYDWEKEKNIIYTLYQKSGCVKVIKEYLEKNYQYYISNRIPFDWSGHFADWLKIVIDKSIMDKMSLTKQYARMVVASYYYNDFSKKGKKEVLYKNLIAMISSEEFKTWIINDVACFERIVQKVEKRFVKEKVTDFDERILITKLVNSKMFQQALVDYPFIDGFARNSKYAKVYIESVQNKSGDIIDLNVKNVIAERDDINKKTCSGISEEVATNSQDTELKKELGSNGESADPTGQKFDLNYPKSSKDNIKEETIASEDNVNTLSYERNKQVDNEADKEFLSNEKAISIQTNVVENHENQKNITSLKAESNEDTIVEGDEVEKMTTKKITSRKQDDFDIILKKLGGNRKVKKTSFSDFLVSIEEELLTLDEIDDFSFQFINGYSDVDLDEEIDRLSYF